MIKVLIGFFASLILILGCGSNQPSESTARNCTVTANSCNASDQCTIPASLKYGGNFKTWLTNNGYSDIASGRGWGGGSSASCSGSIAKTPVIFIHGNGGSSESYAIARSYFLSAGYTDCEIYSVSFQKDNIEQPQTSNNYYSASRIAWVRKFIQAVISYTGQAQVSVVAWSMGVNLARKAITGGTAYADTANTINCSLGSNLSSNIKVFVGMMGVSYGNPTCTGSTYPNCSENGQKVNSAFQIALNGGTYPGSMSPQPLASSIYSMYSPTDSYVCDDDAATNNDSWQPYGGDLPACTNSGIHISQIAGQTASINVDSILPFTPPYNSATNYLVDHLAVGSNAKALQLLKYILENSPNQSTLDTFYSSL